MNPGAEVDILFVLRDLKKEVLGALGLPGWRRRGVAVERLQYLGRQAWEALKEVALWLLQ